MKVFLLLVQSCCSLLGKLFVVSVCCWFSYMICGVAVTSLVMVVYLCRCFCQQS
eukprot:m.118239 g.118239  ORF g.118239 m.118239 type:complete len:54 (-) comp14274_c0_seq9:61-222(-)